MSVELQDFRGKITPETHAALEALSQVTGRDKAEIAREWLHERAVEHIHIATVLQQQLRSKGLRGIDGGASGSRSGAGGSPSGVAGSTGGGSWSGGGIGGTRSGVSGEDEGTSGSGPAQAVVRAS